MTGRVGFACKYMYEDQNLKPKQLKEVQQPLNFRGTTIKWLRENQSLSQEKVYELIIHNLDATERLVDYVSSLPIQQRMLRLGSDMLPAYTEPTFGHLSKTNYITTIIADRLNTIGEKARANDVRLSMHPGQFCVLASDNPDIVERSIEEFEYHVDIARWLGYGKQFQDFKINVHISGRKGPAGILDVYPRLSEEARKTAIPVRSVGTAKRPKGTFEATSAFFWPMALPSSFANIESTCSQCSPSTTPGAMALTLIPCLIKFRPADWVIEITAAFVEQ